MSHGLAEIHARLQAADRALALAGGGSTELGRVREAVGSLLVALHELVTLWEDRESAPSGAAASAAAPGEAPQPRPRGGRR